MKKVLIATALTAILATGCQNGELANIPQGAGLTVTATMGADTRTQVDNNGIVTWSEKDAMLVYGTGVKGTLTLTDGAGETTATFRGNVQGDATNLDKAVYPASMFTVSGTTATLNLTEVTYPNSSSPMVAEWGTTMNFSHLAGMVRINILGLDGEDVSITGTGIGGKATLNADNTLAVVDATATQTITVKSVTDKTIDIPVYAGGTITTVTVGDATYTVENDGLQIAAAGQLNASDMPILVYKAQSVTLARATDKDNVVYNLTGLENAVKSANTTVYLAAGEYGSLSLSNVAEGVTIECVGNVVFTNQSSLNLNGATLIGATFANEENRKDGAIISVRGTVNGTFKNCTFAGKDALRWCYAGETVVFENCVFDGETYGAHFDGGANAVTFRDCTFSGFNTLGGQITLLTLENCTFKATGKSSWNGINLWGATKLTNCEFTFDGTAASEWVDAVTYKDDAKSYEFVKCTVNGKTLTYDDLQNGRECFPVTIDGKEYRGLIKDTNGSCTLLNAGALYWFAEEVNEEGNTFDGRTVKLGASIDLKNQDWEPIGQTGGTTFNGVFDGQDFTISNLYVDSEDEKGENYSSGLFGWVETHTEGLGILKGVKIAGATIKGHHNCGALVGYITEKYAVVENCEVSGATITCTTAKTESDNYPHGDKAGALIGNATNATTVKDCKATDSNISAGCDAGWLIGAAKESNVTGCSATGCTVTNNSTCDGEDMGNRLIGRSLW